MPEKLNLETRLQIIYYQDEKYNLRYAYATSPSRITMKEATEILERREIKYSELLKVKYETLSFELDLNDVTELLLPKN